MLYKLKKLRDSEPGGDSAFYNTFDSHQPELERIAPLLPEHVHQLLGHPVDLRLSKLHHVEGNIVQERQTVCQESRILHFLV